MTRIRNKHRLLGLLLAIMIVLLQFPTYAFAATDVAIVNNQRYSNLNTAWGKVKNGGTITIIADCKADALMVVEKNAKVTVNMGGHIINRGKASTKYYGKGDGQIFFVKGGATLTINGGEGIEHEGYIDGDLWFSGSENGKIVKRLTGGVLTGGACDDHDGAGAITMMENTTVNLYHVNVVGNVSDCYGALYGQGGAIRMHEEDATLNLVDTKIMYNHAEDNGGAILIEDENSTVNMVASEISHNRAEGDGGGIYSDDTGTTIRMSENSIIAFNSADEGGGLYFDYSKFAVKDVDSTSSICYNNARDGHGGGIYVEHRIMAFSNYGSIHGISLEGNTAKGYGGGLYLDQEDISVSNCHITNNNAKYGGGVYVDNDGISLSNCTITGNNASQVGGGVFCSCTNDLALGGKVIVKDNTRGGNSKDDLYLNEGATNAYLSGSPSAKSEVGIRTEGKKERKIGRTAQFYYEDAFFSDLGDDYHIEFKDDKEELWIVKGGKTSIYVSHETPTPTKKNDFNGYPAIMGNFSFPSVIESNEDIDCDFIYSDGFFLNGPEGEYGNPDHYNPHLATMSMCMAMAGFYSNIGNDGMLKAGSDRTYTYKSQNITRLFTDIGVDPDNIYISDSNSVKPGIDTIGVAIGQKPIGSNGEILVPISIRGAGYESEWYGNTSVGTKGEHEGFEFAAEEVYKQVQAYVKDYGLDQAVKNGKVKFWIAGYSRAGATANLTAKRLVELYCRNKEDPATSNQVYAYCFEAPKGGMNGEMDLSADSYYCIHNCINKADAVPLVAPEEMGFIRYGVDHYIPGQPEAGDAKSDKTVWSYVKVMYWADDYRTWHDNNSWTVGSKEYNAQRAKMLRQLKTIDPFNIYFYDHFSPASIEYLGNKLMIYDLIHRINNQSFNQEQFVRILVRSLQAWGFYGSYGKDFRYSYSTCKPQDGGATFEQALQVMTKLFFSKSPDELDSMMTAASGAMERIDNDDDISLLKIYDNMIGDWCSLSQDDRDWYCNKLWENVFEGPGPDGKSVVDFLTKKERDELNGVWYTLIDVMMRFVASDYKYDADEWNESSAMVKDKSGNYSITPILENIGKVTIGSCQVVLGTLAYNANAIMQAHYPEINLAWIRSYDSLYDYDGENPITIVNNSTATVTCLISEDGETFAPAAEVYDDDCLVKLESDIPGAGVFYRIQEDDGEFSEWKPYNRPFKLNAYWTKDTTYVVETTAVYCGKVTPVKKATYQLLQEKDD